VDGKDKRQELEKQVSNRTCELFPYLLGLSAFTLLTQHAIVTRQPNQSVANTKNPTLVLIAAA
jgi:hypothetical protein